MLLLTCDLIRHNAVNSFKINAAVVMAMIHIRVIIYAHILVSRLASAVPLSLLLSMGIGARLEIA